MDDINKTIVQETAKQLPIQEIYEDIGKSVLQSSGEIIGLVPRAINAALLPLHQWIMSREYNVEKTKLLLAEKLKNINPADITTPEPYVAIPAFQAISYCIDNDLLRDMYANLLASSINVKSKDYVHPSYTEIIKQMAPDEARVLNAISKRAYPLIWIRREFEKSQGGYYVTNSLSLIQEDAVCDYEDRIPEYLENLERLKLINILEDAWLTTDGIYDEISNHPLAKELLAKQTDEYTHKINKGYCKISVFGEAFYEVCCSNEW